MSSSASTQKPVLFMGLGKTVRGGKGEGAGERGGGWEGEGEGQGEGGGVRLTVPSVWLESIYTVCLAPHKYVPYLPIHSWDPEF